MNSVFEEYLYVAASVNNTIVKQEEAETRNRDVFRSHRSNLQVAYFEIVKMLW